MKALILVGGFGTRLRPLTWTRPKPMVPFANRPMVLHQVAALKKVGVTEVVLAVNYQSETFDAVLAEWTKQFGVKFSISLEKEPMGTAGPLALARKILTETNAPFFVLNSDVIVAFEEHQILQKMVAFHKQHGKEGTMLVTKVQDPSKYGVVVSDAAGKISAFVEKPKEFVGDCINAGIYLFNQSVLNRIELKPTSIERETFPAMVKDGQLYSQTVTGFWMDIGQPKDYLVGMEMFLRDTNDGKYAASKLDAKTSFAAAGDGLVLTGNVLVDASVRVGAHCTIGPDVIIGRNVVLGDGVTLKRCTVMDGTRIEAGASVTSSIVAFGCTLQPKSAVHDSTVGDGVVVAAGLNVAEAKLWNTPAPAAAQDKKADAAAAGAGAGAAAAAAAKK